MFVITILVEKVKAFIMLLMKQGRGYIFFEEVDDAIRFPYDVEDDGYPQMVVTEVDREVAIQSCEVNDCKYAIITKTILWSQREIVILFEKISGRIFFLWQSVY